MIQFLDSSWLAYHPTFFFDIFMNSFQNLLLSLLALNFLILFGSCGDDALVTSPETGDPYANSAGNQTAEGAGIKGESPNFSSPSVVDSNQEADLNDLYPVKNPGPKWSGTSGDFIAVFGGRGLPGELPRLFVNATAAPYTGSIKRVFSSGKPEFVGDYEDGYLEGSVRWWNSDGSLASSAQVKGGKVVKWGVLGQIESTGIKDTTVKPAFVGTYENVDEWATGFNAGEDDLLVDKKTGGKVSGSVKVLDENRRLKSYTEYKDGMKHGLEVLWNDSGIKIYEISFANGKQHGTETTWDDDGTISSLNIYDNGVLVPPPQE